MIYFINLHMLLNVTSYNIMCLYLTCEVKKILIQSTSVNGISAYVTFDILTEVMKLITTLLSMSSNYKYVSLRIFLSVHFH